MNVYLSRWVCLGVEANLRRAVEESRQAVEAGATLVVFPEVFLTGYYRTLAPARARAAFARISEAHPGIVFAFGSFTEERRNRMTIWRGGGEVARYDKVHLFDPNDEPRIWEAGDRYAAVRTDGWSIGLLTCNDVRFPEQARALRLSARCDALLVVAWWPWRRDHVWRTLLRARAIENGLWVIGCCVAASEHPGERFAGAGNHVFDPHGEPVRTGDDRTYVLDPSRAGKVLVDPLESYRAIEEVQVFDAARVGATLLRKPVAARPSRPARIRRRVES
jgi:predicted amidohydrolase